RKLSQASPVPARSPAAHAPRPRMAAIAAAAPPMASVSRAIRRSALTAKASACLFGCGLAVIHGIQPPQYFAQRAERHTEPRERVERAVEQVAGACAQSNGAKECEGQFQRQSRGGGGVARLLCGGA